MKKRLLAWIMAAAMVLLLCGCGDQNVDTPAATEKPPDEAAETGWKPDGAVTLIVPYGKNDFNDISVRVLTQFVERNIGQSIEIENIPGPITETDEAGQTVEVDGPGSKGWAELARRKPDGLTIGVCDLPGFTDSLARHSGYYTAQDFTAICNHITDTAVLVARESDDRFDDLDELVAYGKEHEGELIAATDGERSNCHAWTELFARSAHLTYGTKHCAKISDALQSVLGGSADFCVARQGDLYGRSKGLRMMGTFSTERLSEYPDTPTVGEQGYYDKWLGTASCIVAPAGVSREVVAFYERAFSQAMAEDRYLSASTGIITNFMGADDTQTILGQQKAFSLSKATTLW